MSSEKLKEYLHQVADGIQEETRLEDVYDQLALLSDIEESEGELERNETLTHQQVIDKSKEWLK